MDAHDIPPILDVVRALPFVSGMRLIPPRPTRQSDALAKLTSRAGVSTFTVETRKSYLDRASLSSIVAAARSLDRDRRPPLLLLARYIPREAGEQLVRSGICFADQSGNVNLSLGDRYHALVLGNRDQGRAERMRRLSPGAVQMLFAALARPELLGEPVRKLAQDAGVGKSTAAEVRRQLLEERLLVVDSAGACRLADQKTIRERFLLGYSQVLRPSRTLGRFRGPYKDGAGFVRALAKACAQRAAPWALTGSAGAYQLDRFYRGPETVAFAGSWDASLARELRLLPDRAGPITILNPFGNLVVWPRPKKPPVAHPWLIYAELLHNGEPRAIEAAEELRRNHLQ
ncbi:hypothetical protein SBA4_120017 [Candidatus Sulfopaludibacter sp. SbA4]|nr:hypothetical protein SBA4_120017 [Candidatus Sulfopaludibacter sp. SbA4]